MYFFFIYLSASGVRSIIISSMILIFLINSFLLNSSPLKADLNSTKTFSCVVKAIFFKISDKNASSVYNTGYNLIQNYSTSYSSNNLQTNSRDYDWFIKTFKSFVRFFETPILFGVMLAKIFDSFNFIFWKRFINIIKFKDVFHLLFKLHETHLTFIEAILCDKPQSQFRRRFEKT